MSSENETTQSAGGEKRRRRDEGREAEAAATVAVIDFVEPPIASPDLIVLAALFAAGARALERAVDIVQLSAITALPPATINAVVPSLVSDSFAVLRRTFVDGAGRRHEVYWIATSHFDLADQAEWCEARAEHERFDAKRWRAAAERMRVTGGAREFEGRARVRCRIEAAAAKPGRRSARPRPE